MCIISRVDIGGTADWEDFMKDPSRLTPRQPVGTLGPHGPSGYGPRCHHRRRGSSARLHLGNPERPVRRPHRRPAPRHHGARRPRLRRAPRARGAHAVPPRGAAARRGNGRARARRGRHVVSHGSRRDRDVQPLAAGLYLPPQSLSPSMRIHSYERAFLVVSGALLVTCVGALVYAATARDMHLPGHVGTVDPAQLAATPPFDQPGVREVGPNRYEVVIIARTWSFFPNEIRVPAGAEVTFIATSGDVIHGFEVARTRLNAMLIPGQITRLTYTFREPGEYLLVCHEYCGVGHHTMGAKVVVQ